MTTSYAHLSDAYIADLRQNLPDLFHLSLKQCFRRVLAGVLFIGFIVFAL